MIYCFNLYGLIDLTVLCYYCTNDLEVISWSAIGVHVKAPSRDRVIMLVRDTVWHLDYPAASVAFDPRVVAQ